MHGVCGWCLSSSFSPPMSFAQMRRMKRVLRRLGHCDRDGVIQTKGRVACEINTCDEMVVTELIFNGAFTDLTLEQTAALLSCMVMEVSCLSLLLVFR